MFIRWVFLVVISAAAIEPCGADPPVKMLSEREACARLKQSLASAAKAGSDCPFSGATDERAFVLTLTEHCGLCTSALKNWYTIDRRTGAIQRSRKPPPGAAPPDGRLHWTAD